MSDIIESIKQGAGQVLSEIDQKGQLKSALEGIRAQWNELERRRREKTLSSQLTSMQGEMKQLTEALGLQTLSLFESGKIANPELARLCERIGELRSEVEQRKLELQELKELAQAQMPVKCPNCQTNVAGGAEFCPKCGTPLRQKAAEPVAATPPQTRTVVRMRCPRCKTILPSDAGFCPTCGVKIKQPQAAVSEKSFCPSCGAETSAGARFCPICGATIS
jgi:RNA polymerase subunit RPABC4/transcription elongation factor Spt4